MQKLTTLKKMHQIAEADLQRAGGLFAPLFRQTQMRPVTKADAPVPEKKVPQTGTRPTPIPAAESARHQNRYVDPNDTAATHNEHLRQTREAHDRLLAEIKAVHNAVPTRHPSTGPVAL